MTVRRREEHGCKDKAGNCPRDGLDSLPIQCVKISGGGGLRVKEVYIVAGSNKSEIGIWKTQNIS